MSGSALCSFFFFNDTATTEIYTLSLHDALPISALPDRLGRAGHLLAEADRAGPGRARRQAERGERGDPAGRGGGQDRRSEEHTSELQSRPHLVCRLLLEKKKWTTTDKSFDPSSH